MEENGIETKSESISSASCKDKERDPRIVMI